MLAELIAELFTTRNSGPQGMRGTGLKSLAVAQTEQPDWELTRAGRRFAGMGNAAGVAPAQAVPTTTMQNTLYNPDIVPYAIDEIGCWLLSGTATAGLTMLGIVQPSTSTKTTAATGSVVASLSAGGRASKAIIGLNTTGSTPGLMAQWFVIGTSVGGVPGIGGGVSFDVRGRIAVPPGYVLGTCVIAGAGTSPLYVTSFKWTETDMQLE